MGIKKIIFWIVILLILLGVVYYGANMLGIGSSDSQGSGQEGVVGDAETNSLIEESLIDDTDDVELGEELI
ncbi:MAG: hypothetical protein AABX73_01700 [Nanoarchaeota archaeon]